MKADGMTVIRVHELKYVLETAAGQATVRPMSAVNLSRKMGLGGRHESVRRTIRKLVKYAREQLGLRICASDGAAKNCGYWLARNAGEWRDYQLAQRSRTRFRFVALARQHRAVTDRMNHQTILPGLAAVSRGT